MLTVTERFFVLPRRRAELFERLRVVGARAPSGGQCRPQPLEARQRLVLRRTG
jgi:hypothetical protein